MAEMPMDEALPGCDLGRMEDPRPTLPDEVHGARAVGSLGYGAKPLCFRPERECRKKLGTG